MSRERTTLYRFHGAAGTLLYIGITLRLPVRLGEHEQWQPWWDEVVGATFEHYPTRREAERAELAAIRAEAPKYNVTGTELGSALASRSARSGTRQRATCPLCDCDCAVSPSGTVSRHHRAVENDHGCLRYYGPCEASGEPVAAGLAVSVRDRARRNERPCRHEVND